MLRTMLKSKIHRATVTQADLHYVGSVTIDRTLMAAADLLPGEQVSVVDITNGARLETYVIPGERDSGVIGINGAAAHLVHPGDLVILMSYAQLDAAEIATFEPSIVFVDGDNHVVHLGKDAGHAPEGSGLISGGTVPSGGESAFPVAETVDAARLDALLRTEPDANREITGNPRAGS